MSYVDVFTGSNVYPSEINYSAIALTANVTLNWPEETAADGDYATRIIDVTPSAPDYVITLPDATMASTGYTLLFNNRGSYVFYIKNASGAQVASVATGTIWQLYLSDNTSAAGVWRVLQFGATTSSATASQLAGTGIKAVGALLSQSVPVTTFSTNYTALSTDRAKLYNWTGASGALTLPTPSSDWFMYVRNSGSGVLVINGSVDGSSSLNFQPGDSAIVASDGTAFYTIGFGQSATFAFDYTVVDVAGSGEYALSGSELNRIAYRFTGTLTGDRNVIVPNTVQQYWVDNQTSGGYQLNIKTAASSGESTVTGQRAILYCDGADVLVADTSGIAIPLEISDGGTGATTTAGALANFGATYIGTSVFTADTATDVWDVLGAVDGGSF